MVSIVQASNEWVFTTCGSTGASGPSQSNCNAEYGSDIDVNVDSDGRQVWEVPFTGEYDITASGAEGGYVDSPRGGRGATISGEFNLDEGDEIIILVGQMGQAERYSGSGSRAQAAGGGGSFVTDTSPSTESDIYLIAGGGGGSVHQSSTSSNADGNSGTSGSDSVGSQTNTGGENGDEGGDSSGSYSGFGGCGFSGSTGGCDQYISGGSGSTTGYNDEEGGFGGGGAGGSSGTHARAAGAGGYSGGAGGRGSTNTGTGVASGGGGSYNNGANQENIGGDNRGHGIVTIELNGPVVSNPRPAYATGTGTVYKTDPELEVDIDHPDGSQDIDVTFFDDSDGSIIGSDTVSPGSTSSVTWSGRDPGEHDWYVEACDENDLCTTEGPWTFEVDISDPEIIGSEVGQFSDIHAFNVTHDVQYDRDNFDDTVMYELSNGVDYQLEHDSSEDYMWQDIDSTNNIVEYNLRVEPDDCPSNNCEGDFQYDVLEEIDIEFTATDEGVGSDTNTFNNREIPNSEPQVILNTPQDGALLTQEDVTLGVEIFDNDDDPLNLTFEDSSGNTLGEFNNLNSGDSRQVEWESLPLGDHEWTAVVNDHYEESDPTFEFTRVISDSFRLEQQVRYEYSSLILTETGTGNAFIDITNPHPDDKEINVELESQDGFFTPTFSENDGDEITVDLSQGETRTLQVSVTADDVTETENDKLIITSTDTNVGSVDVAELDVLVRSSEVEQRGVPGLTSIYLLFIGLAASVLFGLSVW